MSRRLLRILRRVLLVLAVRAWDSQRGPPLEAYAGILDAPQGNRLWYTAHRAPSN